MNLHDVVSVFASHAVLRVLWAFLSIGTVKGCLLVVAAYLLCRLFCSRQPAHAHTVWLLTLVGLVTLPLTWLALPPIQLAPVLERAAAFAGAWGTTVSATALSPDRLLGLTDTAGGYAALSRQSLPGRVPLAAWLLLAAWAAGAGVLLLRAAAGRVAVRRNGSGWALPAAPTRLAQTLCRRFALPRAVVFTASPRCAVPYTFGLLHPVVVMPAGTVSWPLARLRPVLLHELAHVKRRDSLFSLFATLVTALLWWFPPAWVVGRFLARTKELACDRLVLEQGVPAHQYAREMLELVRSSRGNLFVPAECNSFGRKSMVRERIVSVLKAGKFVVARKAGLVVVGFFCCLLPMLAVTCATAPGAGAERLHGAWTNTEYFGTYWTHTFVIYPDERWTWYDRTDTDSPTGESRYVIDRKWTDPQGNRWYWLTARSSYAPYNEEVARATLSYLLAKIDPQGDRLEIETSLMTWPESFGALGNFHYVYYRKR